MILKDDAWTEQANWTSADKKHKIIDPLRLRRNEKSTTALLPPKAEIAKPPQGVLDQNQGLSQAAPLRQSRTAIGIVPLKNGQGDNLSPSKFREKTRNAAHTKRFISVQLQAETERGKYILSHL